MHFYRGRVAWSAISKALRIGPMGMNTSSSDSCRAIFLCVISRATSLWIDSRSCAQPSATPAVLRARQRNSREAGAHGTGPMQLPTPTAMASHAESAELITSALAKRPVRGANETG